MMVSSLKIGIIKPCFFMYGLRTVSKRTKIWKMIVSKTALTISPENADALNPGLATSKGSKINGKKSVFVPKLSKATAEG